MHLALTDELAGVDARIHDAREEERRDPAAADDPRCRRARRGDRVCVGRRRSAVPQCACSCCLRRARTIGTAERRDQPHRRHHEGGLQDAAPNARAGRARAPLAFSPARASRARARQSEQAAPLRALADRVHSSHLTARAGPVPTSIPSRPPGSMHPSCRDLELVPRAARSTMSAQHRSAEAARCRADRSHLSKSP